MRSSILGYQSAASPVGYRATPSPISYSPMTPGAPYTPATPGAAMEQGAGDWVVSDTTWILDTLKYFQYAFIGIV